MAGRIRTWLLVCDPPDPSAAEIAAELGASKGSMSTNLRTLEMAGLIQRSTRPGERIDRYQIQPNAWSEAVITRIGQLTIFLDAYEDGLRLLDDTPPQRRDRLIDSIVFYEWLSTEMPGLMERWKVARPGLLARRREQSHDQSESIPKPAPDT